MTARQASLYSLWPKQQFAFDLIWSERVEQLLYGGAAGGAKDLALDTPIPTPDGWTTMGEICDGDLVLSEHGRPLRVVKAHPVLPPQNVYSLTFDDGAEVVAGEGHLWLTFDADELGALTKRTPEWRAARRLRRESRVSGNKSERFTASLVARNRLHAPPTLPAPTGAVRTTAEIASTLRTHTGRANHAVPVSAPLDLPDADLPLDPYLLGCWLGDGTSADGGITTMDAEIEASFAAGGFPFGKKRMRGRAWNATALGLKPVLREIGVLGNKQVPIEYLRASREQRLALLQGLMDTDGTASADSGAPSFTNTRRALIDGVHELIVSLGWKARIVEFEAKLHGRVIGPAWDIKWKPDAYVFRLTRKRERQVLATRRTTRFRYIIGCERVPTVPTRCITVASTSGLFLATRNMVPTHNSHFVRGLAAYLAVLWPGSLIGIFRRTDSELMTGHVNPWLEEVDPFVSGGRFFQQKMQYVWPSPSWCWCPKGEPCTHSSTTAFRHVDDNRGARKHQGAEFAAELVDEATHFHGKDIDFLYTRVRTTADRRNPRTIMGPDGRNYDYPGWPGWLKLQVLTANPGDVGHQYMLDNFVDPESGLAALLAMGEESTTVPRRLINGPTPLTSPEGWTVWEEPVSIPVPGTEEVTQKQLKVDMTGGHVWTVEIDIGLGRPPATVKRAFVPARLEDNPALDPEEYAANLAVGSAETRRRLLDGDWSYSEDRVFKMIDRKVHSIDGRKVFGKNAYGETKPPPISWPRGAGQDHGTAKPTAVIWVCQEEEGFFIAYKEYYSPGPVGTHVRAIKEILDWDGHPEISLAADPRLWHRTQGIDVQVSVAAIYEHLGMPPEDPGERRMARNNGIRLHRSGIDDKASLLGLEGMLEPDPERLFPYWHPLNGIGGAPQLFITEDCPNLWRELTSLKHPSIEADGLYGEGIKNGQPDHAFDAVKRIAEPLRRALITARYSQGPRRVLEAV